MSKLLQRLSDPAKSGVYRSSRSDEILDATRASKLRVAQIDLAGATDKDKLVARVAAALEFPSWFGGNWDALEDCLCDLSWMTAAGHVLLLTGAVDVPRVERGTLVDILAAAAASWAERKHPFFAVFLDGEPALPSLYNERK
ncbi:MAG TPA: barstar family protein [Burkholderiales bacterium]|nr:barstar family protein [Burkholderiales bacterium]